MTGDFTESIYYQQTYTSAIKHSKDTKPCVKPRVKYLCGVLFVLCSAVDLRKLTLKETFVFGPAVLKLNFFRPSHSASNEVAEDFLLDLDYKSLNKTCVCLLANFPIFHLKEH